MNVTKKLSLLVATLVMGVGLTACGSLDNSSMQSSTNNVTGKKNKKNNYQTTGSASGSYAGVIKNGKYVTSKSRGLTADQNGNVNNTKSFESGLQDISKKIFPTSQYVFQEGQYLSSDTVQNWLDRESKSNPEGLNPKDNGSKDPDKRNPIYLQALEEQDYMEKSGTSLKLKGVTIGLAMNSVDYYQKEQYGAQYETKISDAEIKAKSQEIAQKVLERLRKKSEFKNVPIVIAVYKQASNDSLVGGTFMRYSNNSGEKLAKWKDLDYKNVVYPISDTETSPNSNDSSAFDNFNTQVESFFPNLSGITAKARYDGKSMEGMSVSITTQFYSETEINSFTQFVSTQAEKYLPSGVNIDITIKSTDEVQSFLSRSAKEKTFSSHVFSSY
ncbi:CamS family sex pheromone protein [Pediococcus pentosaceus]|uniref:CamS family sex pheromone protein n=1 Tax=Pediococcus pentosaceus TaxID=1255 RepID=UPI00132F938B|nr:CamS family sex pheromone protein [Pediococcus pentosaceus]KAF0506473.1 CamS family sex pheromone protein [Pediococcus pentosaceus]MBF7139581.1 CamS family sex pheromone protein [Pediococcus pentosaceus]MCM6820185.1 CamS family sex pheromone protein [Pediococcus pentosaceus]